MDPDEILKLIRQLDEYKGRHTELISVYVPAGASLIAVSKQLEQEKSTAANIKSKSTQKNVVEALEKIVRELKMMKQTPSNGLAVFCGNISRKEGQQDIKFFSIEPHVLLNVKLYRCDQKFVTNPLRDLVEKRDKYGLMVIERNEATIGLLDGKNILVLEKFTSGIPGKVKAGGSSSARFGRVREFMTKEYFVRVAEALRKNLGEIEIKGLLIGGPGPTKEEFLNETDIGPLKNKIIAIEDIGYSDEYGLEVLVEKAQDKLQEEEIIKEKKLIQKFFNALARNPDKVVYGLQGTEKALEMGAADQVLISENSKISDEKINEIKKHAENSSAEILKVSTETEEGNQFLSLGGIGAFLRFKIG